MAVSALPGENGTQEMGVDINKTNVQTHPDVINCNSKNGYHILTSFAKNIPDLGH